MRVIDVHHLLGVDNWLSRNQQELAPVNSGESAAAQLDAAAPSCVAVSFPSPSCRDGSDEQENAAVLDAAAASPQLIPALAVNPRNEKAQGYLPRLLRHVFPADDAGALAGRRASEVLAALFASRALSGNLTFSSSYPFSLWWGGDVGGEVAWMRDAGLNPADLERLHVAKALEFYGEPPARAWGAVSRTDHG